MQKNCLKKYRIRNARQVIALHILNAEKKLKSTEYQMPTPTVSLPPLKVVNAKKSLHFKKLKSLEVQSTTGHHNQKVPRTTSPPQPPPPVHHPPLQVVNAKKLFKKVQVIALHILNAEKS